MNLKFQVYEVLTKYYVILVMIYFSSAQTKKFKKYIWRANQLFDMRNLLTVVSNRALFLVVTVY